MRSVKVFIFAFVLSLSAASAADKPTMPSVPIAPVPSQIASAKRVFISNAFGREWTPEGFVGPDLAYNSFYAALEKASKYEVVLAPSDADLILEVRFGYPLEDVHRDISGPRMELNIFDPHAHVLLWSFWQNVKSQGGPHFAEKNAKNLDQASSAVVQKLVKLASRPAQTQP